MFFIGVFGIENKSKEIKTLNNLTCKKCENKVNGRLIKYYDFFHFFFIPLFRWNEKYYVLCDKCKCLYSIPKDKGKAIERGEDGQLTYWDLQEVYDNDYSKMNYNNNNIKTCSQCGGKVNLDFKYCPYCGREI